MGGDASGQDHSSTGVAAQGEIDKADPQPQQKLREKAVGVRVRNEIERSNPSDSRDDPHLLPAE